MDRKPNCLSKQSSSLFNVNTQSICAKKLEFKLTIEDVKPDVTVACETWLSIVVNACHPVTTILSGKTEWMAMEGSGLPSSRD